MPFPGAKASCYDSGLRCPTIVSSPAAAGRGVASNALVGFTSILPTALDWLGVPLPAYPLHGRSLLPILEQESPAGFDEIFFTHTFHEINNYYPFRGIRTRRYKYIRFLYPELEMPLPSDLFASPTWRAVRRERLARLGLRHTAAVMRHSHEELCEVERDRRETTDLARSPASGAILEELREKVQRFRRASKEPWGIVDEQCGQVSGNRGPAK